MDIVRVDAVEIVRLDHKRVAFPSSDGVTVPIRLRLSLTRQRTAVHVDRAEAVIRLGDVENLSRHPGDLYWLWIDVVFKRTLRQAQPIRIVQAILRSALLLELRGPWLERQPVFESLGSSPLSLEVVVVIQELGAIGFDTLRRFFQRIR